MPTGALSLRWIDRAATAMLVSVAIAMIAAAACSFVGYRLLVDQSDSMRPALAAGDLIVTERVSAGSLKRGDIVTFADTARGGRLITHRVASIKRAGERLTVTTRGDANSATESWTTRTGSTVQRLSTHVPRVGRALNLLGTIPLPALIVIGVVLVVPALLLRAGGSRT